MITSMPLRWRLLEAAAVLLLLAGAWLAAMEYLQHNGRQHDFIQKEFAPAVMVACGRGYINVDRFQVPELEGFLRKGINRTVERFDCSALPADLGAIQQPLNYYNHGTFQYLWRGVGWAWSVVGISWEALYSVQAGFHGLTVLLAYGLFRLGSGPLWSLAGGLFMAFSSQILWGVKSVRDYPKGVFFLALWLIMGWLVKRRHGAAALLILALLGGVLVGIGLGVRKEILVAVPAFIGVLLLFGDSAAGWRLRALAVALFLGAMLASGWPLFELMSRGGTQGNVAVVGQTTNYNRILGLDNPLYEIAREPCDYNGISQIRHHAQRTRGEILKRPDQHGFEPEFYRASARFMEELMREFPADMWMRGLGAVDRLSDKGIVKQGGVLVLLAAIGVTAWISLRQGLFLGLFALLFYAYTFLQFHQRHYFHVLVIPLWVTLMLANALIRGALSWRGGRPAWLEVLLRPAVVNGAAGAPAAVWTRGWRAVLLCGAILGALAFGPLPFLTIWQAGNVGVLVAEVEKAPLEDLPFTETAELPGQVMLRLRDVPRGRQAPEGTDFLKINQLHPEWAMEPEPFDYLLLRFRAEQCPRTRIPVTMHHGDPGQKERNGDYVPWPFVVPLERGETRFYHPVFNVQRPMLGLAGISLPRDARSCLTQLARVTQAPPLVVLPTLMLPYNWMTLPRRLSFGLAETWGEWEG
ncbi:MAG: hypothetical protein HQL82_07785 [Magnetococcales bacterium]|nr:hypothetical protein [Magnetococcales bacterium]